MFISNSSLFISVSTGLSLPPDFQINQWLIGELWELHPILFNPL